MTRQDDAQRSSPSSPDVKLPYFKMSGSADKWVLCGGAQGCEIVRDVELGTARPPPLPPSAPTDKQEKSVPIATPLAPAAKMLTDIIGMVDAMARFKKWLDAPIPPTPVAPAAAPQEKVETVPPFDIQEIPAAMRRLNMPMGAKLMERWFAGELNYSPDDAAELMGINQDGAPYPPSMINKTDITMKWVLGFERAKEQYIFLIKHAIRNHAAYDKLKEILILHRQSNHIDAKTHFSNEITNIHKHLQFQMVGVESSWPQKIRQAIIRTAINQGTPDDLTATLGSFRIYAAIERASFEKHYAIVDEISIYVKDNYTFSSHPKKISQYLGHWSKNGVIIVPPTVLATHMGYGFANSPVKLGNEKIKGNVYYPVRNSDFRNWQIKHHRGGDFIIYTDRILLSLLMNPIKVIL